MKESKLVADGMEMRLYIDAGGVPVLRTWRWTLPKRFPQVAKYASSGWLTDKAKYWWQDEDSYIGVDVLPRGETDVLDYVKYVRGERHKQPIYRLPLKITSKRIHDTLWHRYLYIRLTLKDTVVKARLVQSSGTPAPHAPHIDELIPEHWMMIGAWVEKHRGQSIRNLADNDVEAVLELESLVDKVKDNGGKILWRQ